MLIPQVKVKLKIFGVAVPIKHKGGWFTWQREPGKTEGINQTEYKFLFFTVVTETTTTEED